MSIPKKTIPSSSTNIPDDGIGLRIKAAREALKYSQIDMHKITGLSRTVLINYEAGRHKPGSREIKIICDALKISPNYLIYGTEQPHSLKDDFADTILSMGAGAIVPLTFLIPLLNHVLGYEEKRKILEFVEVVIKAQSHELLADVMSILQAVPGASELDIEKLIDEHPDPERSRRVIQMFKDRIDSLPRKN